MNTTTFKQPQGVMTHTHSLSSTPSSPPHTSSPPHPHPLHTRTTSDLPPSQGGRYGGFGNTVEPTKKQESEFLTGTWSSITSVSDPKRGEGGEREK